MKEWKGKVLGFALALVSVATIGVMQLQANAESGSQVGNAPICNAKAVGERGSAFTIKGNSATVHFTVSGKADCKVRLSGNSFYAPSMNGLPYEKQILFQRVTKIYTPGKYSMTVALPAKSTPAKGCFYQVDLTYGTHNVLPVLAYGHGKLDCSNPTASCDSLNVVKLERTKFTFTARATAKGGAKINGYKFTVSKNGQFVAAKTVTTSNESASITYVQETAGDYQVRVRVLTSEGEKTGDNCVKQFTVQDKPLADCKALTVQKLSRTSFKFTASAEVYRAKVTGYVFKVMKDGVEVDTKTVDTANLSTSVNYTQTTVGDYTVRVSVKTTLGSKTNDNCVKPFTVTPPEEQPVAKCKSLTVETLEDNAKFRFDGVAEVSGGATISGYEFTVRRGNTVVDTVTVNSTATTASTDYTQTTPGTYDVQLVVKTSVGDKNGPQCKGQFVVEQPEEHPGVKVTKLVEGVKYKRVGVNVEFEYQIAVTNTGDVDLENVKVTDTPEAGVTLLSGSAGTVANNTWTYTIPSLTVGETENFTLIGKVPVEVAGRITNTVCVDAPEVPGNPDDCDTADVEVKKVYVCDPETGEIIKVDESEADNYLPVNSPECQDITVCNLETKEVVTIKKSEFNANPSMYSADLSDCDEEDKVYVCDPATGEIIQVDESDADGYLPANSDECKEITVCNTQTGEIITIKKSDFDSSVHSSTLADCEETPETPNTPQQPPVTELPTTGAADVAMQVIGATSLAGAGAYYLLSRRERA